MIFRLSQKLSKKIAISISQYLHPDKNPFIDWSAHLFKAQRTQYILLTNTHSLYSLIMHGKGITNDKLFLKTAIDTIREFMINDENLVLYEKLIVPGTVRMSFSKSTDRKVIGSMNDLIRQAKYYLTERNMSPFDVSFIINDIPMSCLGYNKPRETFKSLRI